MEFNWDYFCVLNSNDSIKDVINYNTSYYGLIYAVFNADILFDEFKLKLLTLYNADQTKGYENMALKIFRYIILNCLTDFNISDYIDNADSISDSITIDKINEFTFNLATNKIISNNFLYKLYINILNDKSRLIYYYYKYYQNIFDNLNTELHPIQINILDKDKLEIYEGTHRFIFSYIKNIKPTFVIIGSKCELFNDIMNILNNDYEEMYKKNYDTFAIYNKIPHTIFSNFETIREDRSEYIIDFLKKYNFKNGLEIGPQNGLLSIQLAKQNYNMQCIEYDKKYYNLTNYIIQLCDVNNKCLVIHDDITKCYTDIKKFDFIASLSVFYHLKRNNPILFEHIFIELIKHTKVLIFDDETKTNIFTINDIKEYINKINVSTTIEIIYEGKDGRTIYAIVQNNII